MAIAIAHFGINGFIHLRLRTNHPFRTTRGKCPFFGQRPPGLQDVRRRSCPNRLMSDMGIYRQVEPHLLSFHDYESCCLVITHSRWAAWLVYLANLGTRRELDNRHRPLARLALFEEGHRQRRSDPKGSRRGIAEIFCSCSHRTLCPLACAASQRMVSGRGHETMPARPATAIRLPVVFCGAPGVKTKLTSQLPTIHALVVRS